MAESNEVDAGRLADVPTDRCVAIGDGRAVVTRVGDDVVAMRNRCLHRDSPLAEGRVLDRGAGAPLLQCPQHFWRYELPTGEHTGGEGRLATYPVRVVDGHVVVDVPPPPPAMSLRERMLAHARDWDRDAPPAPRATRRGDRCVEDRTPR